jgi:hypothetical protein
VTEILLHIKDGSVTNKDALKQALNLPDGKYLIRIKRAGKRSLNQNRYYFKVIVGLITDKINSYGNDFSKEEIHEWLKSKFNYQEMIIPDTAEFDKIPKSTTGLNTLQFSDYMDKIKIYAAESLDLFIPDPGQSQDIWSYDKEIIRK